MADSVVTAAPDGDHDDLNATTSGTGRKVVLTSGLVINPANDEQALTEQTPVEHASGTVVPPPVPDSDEPLLSSGIGDPLQKEEPDAYTLNLGDVLSLANQQNPNVNLARERINEAYAFVERADVLWVPSLRSGFNINHHEGNVQAVDGSVMEVSKGAWYGGLGAFGVGSNSPVIPGVIAQFQMTDAIFQPRITRHQAASREFGATAVRNDTLRSTSVTYLELVRAEHALAISLEAFHNTKKLVEVTEQFAKTGQGLTSDYERMLAELAIRRAEVISREEAVRVASARLAQFLHADPTVPIVSGEPAIIPYQLMDHDLPARAYVSTGLSRRPELAEQQHLVCEAVERLNREKYAPLIPSVILGMSYGGMGGGTGGNLGNADGRLDMDAVAYWEIRNLGFGEQAARNAGSSGVRQAQHRQVVMLDLVAREVVEAHTQVNERQRRIDVAKAGVKAAETSYTLNLQRIENIQGLPIESLQAVQALANARQTYLNAVVDYNIAQVEFVRATGWFMDAAP
ncbi:MAG TPA: TolC family protein [Planctomicrobium sp.]|nr:TolC family protein [Planctomicrobium sp.]